MPVSSRRLSTTWKMYCARRGQAGADGGAAEVHDAQPLLAFVDAPAVAVDGLGVGAHLAAQRREHGVLQLRAADLDDVGEFFFRRLKRFLERHDILLQRLQRRMAASRNAVG
jgi:hypothetical protein